MGEPRTGIIQEVVQVLAARASGTSPYAIFTRTLIHVRQPKTPQNKTWASGYQRGIGAEMTVGVTFVYSRTFIVEA